MNNLDEINIEGEWADDDIDAPKKCNKDEECNGCFFVTEFNMYYLYTVQKKSVYTV